MTVATAVMSLLTLLTVVYFWLTEHARLQRYALAFFPQHRRERARDVWNQVESRLGRWVRAQLILMSALGIGTLVAYTLLGVPSAVLLALWAALAEGIPIVGPLLGAIPPSSSPPPSRRSWPSWSPACTSSSRSSRATPCQS